MDTPAPDAVTSATDAGTACTETSDGNDKQNPDHIEPIEDTKVDEAEEEPQHQNPKSHSMDGDHQQTATADEDDEKDAAKSAYTFCGYALSFK